MRQDFRKQCFSCNSRSPVVACDGTKIGIGFKETFVVPIETTDSGELMVTPNHRYDRTFIRAKDTRVQLKTFCQGVLQNSVQSTPPELEKSLPSDSQPSFRWLNCIQTDSSVRHLLATLFSMLSSDASVDTLIPVCIAAECYSFSCQALENGMEVDTCSAFCENLREVSPEFANLVQCVMHFPNSLFKDIILLLCLCSSMVIYIHDHDVPPEQAQLIPRSYNPPQYGRAYYFENHGHQVRQMRKFSIDSKSGQNFDDYPSVKCEKIFPQVSKRGVS